MSLRVARLERMLMALCSIHNLGLVGHIEDIAVAKDQQGKKLGLRIIQALDGVAEAAGAYKVGFVVFFWTKSGSDRKLRRPSSIAPRPMKASTSSVGTSVPA
jgi:N-acetylglutamate synthase-like GNAT family acetyltransferase